MRIGAAACAMALGVTLGLAGCGTKTGLFTQDDAGEPDDAGRDVGPSMDGGFDTFPCRWTYSRATEITRGALDASAGALKAAVALRRGQALSLAGGAGGVTDLADPPAVLHEARLDDASGGFSGFSEGWLQVRSSSDGSRCVMVQRDESLDVVSTGRTLLPAPCFVDDNDGSDTLLTAVGDGRITVRKPAGGRFFEIDAEASYARTVRMRDGGVVVAALGESQLDAYAITGGGDEIRAPGLARQTLPFVVAPDRLRGGMIVLRFGPEGTWRLERIRLEGGELRLSTVADLSSLPAQPFTSLASNETEALFPLTNGALVYVPLNGAEPRVLEPVPERAVTSMVVALRPGESTGGLAYTQATGPGRGQVLRFRPIVCHR